jgi:hypothetical protein
VRHAVWAIASGFGRVKDGIGVAGDDGVAVSEVGKGRLVFFWFLFFFGGLWEKVLREVFWVICRGGCCVVHVGGGETGVEVGIGFFAFFWDVLEVEGAVAVFWEEFGILGNVVFCWKFSVCGRLEKRVIGLEFLIAFFKFQTACAIFWSITPHGFLLAFIGA